MSRVSTKWRITKEATLYTHPMPSAVPHALAHPGQAACAQVLTGVGGHGGADALQGHRQDLARLGACGHGSHRSAAQPVDRSLQHNAAHRRDACTCRPMGRPIRHSSAQMGTG